MRRQRRPLLQTTLWISLRRPLKSGPQRRQYGGAGAAAAGAPVRRASFCGSASAAKAGMIWLTIWSSTLQARVRSNRFGRRPDSEILPRPRRVVAGHRGGSRRGRLTSMMTAFSLSGTPRLRTRCVRRWRNLGFWTTWTPRRSAFASGDRRTSWARQNKSGHTAPWGVFGRRC